MDYYRLEVIGIPVSDVDERRPDGAPGSRFAFFTNPDGNAWSVQELKR